MLEPVVVSLEDLEHCQSFGDSIGTRHLIRIPVPFETLEEAFGPSSLGILIVKDLPSRFCRLRHELLSYSSYLANLPTEELGTWFGFVLQDCSPAPFHVKHLFPALLPNISADGVTAKKRSRTARTIY